LSIYLIFFVFPFFYAFYFSFFNWSGITRNETFVGLYNFKTLIGEPEVWKAFFHNIKFILITFLPVFVLSLTFAYILVRSRLKKLEGRLYRVLVFTPNVLSIVIICMVWSFIYSPQMGFLNNILTTVGMGSLAQDWLGNASTVIPSIAVVQIWTYTGFYIVLFIAAIKRIPEQIYESALIDGAGPFRQLVNITLPLIWNIIRISMIFFIINGFKNNFAYVNIMTNGGPNGESQVLETYMYNKAFIENNFGYATAVGFLTFAITFIFQGIVGRVTKREEYEL
jgi:ABC-type sugar transport systems, permease components